MPALPIAPHHPRFSCDVTYAADWDGHRPFSEAAFGFGAIAPSTAVGLLWLTVHSQAAALRDTPKRQTVDAHMDAGVEAVNNATAAFAVASPRGRGMPRPSRVVSETKSAKLEWRERNTVEAHPLHAVASCDPRSRRSCATI